MLGLQNGNEYGREFIKNLNREGEYAVGDGHPCLAHSLLEPISICEDFANNLFMNVVLTGKV